MVRVITYGTYDLLHYGHIRLLERAKALGDYLIVGITSDDFDKTRGKINVKQPLEERVNAVRDTGIADKIIIEEYEGQKIDDIKKYGIDIFTVGSDWTGRFDYLEEFCKVVYLERTQGVSSSEIRDQKQSVDVGLVGYDNFLNKIYAESRLVDGANVVAVYSDDTRQLSKDVLSLTVADCYDSLLANVDAVYVHSHPSRHYLEVKEALEAGKHVLCESPMALNREQAVELDVLAKSKGCILMEAMRTAYSTAYARMLLLIKGGKIGEVVSVDATCTSLSTNSENICDELKWSSMTAWGPTALLPVFQILGTDYKDVSIVSRCGEDKTMDEFSKVDFIYQKATASIKVGTGVKSEGELIVSGTEGYIYVPAPWWKMDYFEIRYENPADNRRYFYQLDGEGIRYELVAFMKMIAASLNNSRESLKYIDNIDRSVSYAICDIIDKFITGKCVRLMVQKKEE